MIKHPLTHAHPHTDIYIYIHIYIYIYIHDTLPDREFQCFLYLYDVYYDNLIYLDSSLSAINTTKTSFSSLLTT